MILIYGYSFFHFEVDFSHILLDYSIINTNEVIFLIFVVMENSTSETIQACDGIPSRGQPCYCL